MSIVTRDPREWLNQIADQANSSLSNHNIDWMNALRTNARKKLNEDIIPHRKQEMWRYSNIDSLFKEHYQVAGEKMEAIQLLDIDEFFVNEIETYRIVLVNGFFSSELSSIQNLPDGVKLGSLSKAINKDHGIMADCFDKSSNHNRHVFSALNTAYINDGLFMEVGEGIKLDKPVEVINVSLSVDEHVIIQPRSLCVLKQDAKATLLERHLSTGDSTYFNNNLMEIILEDYASLKHYRLQQESHKAYHLGSIFISQKESSEYINSSFSLGSSWSRTEYNVEFNGQYAQCHFKGLYFVGDEQTQDFHLDIRHDIPNCSSSQNFKGILYGKGRAVFDGLIYVEKDAQKTDAHLSNKNLMLSRQAEIDSKPQLEIYADDVKCSHGTTIGQLEQQQIYYLRSRGISETAAKKMLCLGFAGEIIDDIEIDSLKQQLHKQVSRALKTVSQNNGE